MLKPTLKKFKHNLLGQMFWVQGVKICIQRAGLDRMKYNPSSGQQGRLAL